MSKIPTFLFTVGLALAAAAPAADETVTPAAFSADVCIAYALDHSRELRKLEIESENQDLNTLIQRARFAWGLSANGTHTEGEDAGRNNGSASATRKIPGEAELKLGVSATDDEDSDNDSGTISLSLSKIILGGGSVRKSRLAIENSLLDELIRRNTVHRYRRELAFRVRRAFYAILRDYRTVRIWDLREDRARRNLEHAQERDNPLDIANAELELPDIQASLLRAKRAIDTSIDNLKLLIGMPLDNAFEIERDFTFSEQEINIEADLAYCFENHEDILNRRLELAKLEADAEVKRGEILPEVKVTGSASQGSEDGIDFGADPEYSVGLSLNWALGEQADRARSQQALNNIIAQQISLEQVREDRAKVIRELGRRLAETADQIRLQDQRVTFGVRLVELYRDRWENGDTDILEYVRSQNNLENSRIQLVNLKTTYQDILSEYLFAVGR